MHPVAASFPRRFGFGLFVLALPVSTRSPITRKARLLNGTELKLAANDDLPTVSGESFGSGNIVLAPATFTFLGFAEAANTACR
jgi:hypothetical protein